MNTPSCAYGALLEERQQHFENLLDEMDCNLLVGSDEEIATALNAHLGVNKLTLLFVFANYAKLTVYEQIITAWRMDINRYKTMVVYSSYLNYMFCITGVAAKCAVDCEAQGILHVVADHHGLILDLMRAGF